MEPRLALPEDCHRYYHDGWMIHDSGRVYRVTVCDLGSFMGYNVQSDMQRRVPLNVDELHPFYPEGMAFNHPTWGGIHVQRRARQCIRRTASLQHYEVAWAYRSLSMDRDIMECLIKHEMMPDYPSINEYRDWVDPTAISPTTIIVPREKKDPLVVYMGQNAGTLRDGLFCPMDEYAVVTKLVRMENILCI